MTESFHVGYRAENDTSGSRFYLLFCKALELKDIPPAEDNDPDFWHTISLIGVIAWNLSFEPETGENLIQHMEKEYDMSLPPSFHKIMTTMIEDRRAAFPDESCLIKKCRFEWPDMIVEY